MESIEIRKVTIVELEELQKISKLTFTETFSSDNTEENMNLYLDKTFSIEKLKTELADKNAAFYFALLDNKVIGYLKVNFESSQTEIKDENSIEIERIYVLKEFHGKKVGQLLYNKAIEIAKQKMANYVWLGVWEMNYKAIRFYQKMDLWRLINIFSS
ncbi:GNAT family N-acetyltransferase [Niabella ginsengisoli]|uniref:GNAT family N-acetyltransferase n=1 Tax=Niabella ginsengisoli TaxID=522298 RepID=A0ABS9SQS1_9BACT|nr:GNAT family N-acetyltransferase [Niabella ginsengisoli]MCH5600730.1 GNAT family N-acetyltransferase [Niabella ginsengisoli]